MLVKGNPFLDTGRRAGLRSLRIEFLKVERLALTHQGLQVLVLQTLVQQAPAAMFQVKRKEVTRNRYSTSFQAIHAR